MMKIDATRLDAPTQARPTTPGADKTGDAFAKLLAEQGGVDAGSAGPAVVASPGLFAAGGITEASGIVNEEEQTVMARIDGVLGKWERYAQGLGGPFNLREAHGALAEIEREVGDLKGASDKAQPGLQSVVAELEILAVTERHKLNRGDYL